MMQFTMIQKVAIWILPLLFGITVHEVAHGWVASRLGDKTAQRLGRLTLNPIKHIDWLGTVLVPFVLLLISPVVFGWAKPVPVTQQNLRHPRRDMALVALAGPLSNLIMAFIWGFIMKIGTWLMPVTSQIGVPLALMGQAGIFVNVMLMVLNLIPIPPLDGGRVVSNLLP
ncbi:MAG: site-2 protease family protein, partial [Pseudomonadota bacterium]